MSLEAGVAFGVPSVDGLVGAFLELVRGLLRGVDVAGLLKHALVRKFALGGGGALGIVMLGYYLRKAEVVLRLLSTAGAFLMLFGVLSLLGVIDLNVARVATALRGVLGAGVIPARVASTRALASESAPTRNRTSGRARGGVDGRESLRAAGRTRVLCTRGGRARWRGCERGHPRTARGRGSRIHVGAYANRVRARECCYGVRESYYAIQYSIHSTAHSETPESQ